MEIKVKKRDHQAEWPKHVIDEVNTFFEGVAKLEMKNNLLSISVGTRTMNISLPGVIGCESQSVTDL